MEVRNMEKERFDKMEDLLSKVIYMVGNLKEGHDRIEGRLDRLDGRQDKLQNDLQNTKEELLAKLSEMQADQNFIWGKAVRNERELAKIKAYLQI